MRLSDIKGERALDVIADLCDPIVSIATDGEVRELLASLSGDTADAARKVIPALLKGHRQDIVSILAVLDDVTPEEYLAGASLAGLVEDLYELLTDEEILRFLS